ncbi:hypothetical protein S83_069991, partial [Arachis hypogaea]
AAVGRIDARQDDKGGTTRGRGARSRDKARKATRKSMVSRERKIRIGFETLLGLETNQAQAPVLFVSGELQHAGTTCSSVYPHHRRASLSLFLSPLSSGSHIFSAPQPSSPLVNAS